MCTPLHPKTGRCFSSGKRQTEDVASSQAGKVDSRHSSTSTNDPREVELITATEIHKNETNCPGHFDGMPYNLNACVSYVLSSQNSYCSSLIEYFNINLWRRFGVFN